MWFITSGINGGIPEMIGDAFNEEMVIILNLICKIKLIMLNIQVDSIKSKFFSI